MSYSYSHSQIVVAGMKYELENHIKIEIQRMEQRDNEKHNNMNLNNLYTIKEYIERRCKIIEDGN